MTREKLIERIEEMEKGTKYEQNRARLARYYLAKENFCAKWGYIAELVNARPHSKKNRISAQNIPDNTIPFVNSKGNLCYKAIEEKTNGGRIEDLLDKATRVRCNFIRYQMIDVPVTQSKSAKAKGLPKEYRNTACKIIPTELFINKLYELNAVKVMNHNGKQDGWGIQVSKKAWFEWVDAYPVEYFEDEVYEEWMFEGLE